MPKKKGKKRHHKEISKSTTSSSSSNNDTLKSTNESIEEDNKNHPRPKMDNNDGDDVGIDSRYPPNEQPISNRKATISQFSSWNQAFQAAASITPHDLGKDYVDPSSTTKSGDDDNVPFGSGNVGGISQIANEYLMTKSENSSCLQEKGDNMESRDDYKREDSFVIKGKDEVETSSIFPTKKKKKKKDSKKKKKKTKTKSEDNDENGDTNINDEEKDTVVNEIENNHDSDNQNLEGKMITHQDQSVMVLVDYQHEKVYSALNRSKDGNLIEVGIVGKNCEIEITNEDGLISSNSPSKDEIGTFFSLSLSNCVLRDSTTRMYRSRFTSFNNGVDSVKLHCNNENARLYVNVLYLLCSKGMEYCSKYICRVPFIQRRV